MVEMANVLRSERVASDRSWRGLLAPFEEKVDELYGDLNHSLARLDSEVDDAIAAWKRHRDRSPEWLKKQAKLEDLKGRAIKAERARLPGVPDAEWPHWARRDRRIEELEHKKLELNKRREADCQAWRAALDAADNEAERLPVSLLPTLARSDSWAGREGLAMHSLGYTGNSSNKSQILRRASSVKQMLGCGHTLCASPGPLENTGIGLVVRGEIVEKFVGDALSVQLSSKERITHPGFRARRNEDWFEGWIRPREVIGIVPGYTPEFAGDVSNILGVPIIGKNKDGSFDWGGLVSSQEARQLNRSGPRPEFKRATPTLSEIMGFPWNNSS